MVIRLRGWSRAGSGCLIDEIHRDLDLIPAKSQNPRVVLIENRDAGNLGVSNGGECDDELAVLLRSDNRPARIDSRVLQGDEWVRCRVLRLRENADQAGRDGYFTALPMSECLFRRQPDQLSARWRSTDVPLRCQPTWLIHRSAVEGRHPSASLGAAARAGHGVRSAAAPLRTKTTSVFRFRWPPHTVGNWCPDLNGMNEHPSAEMQKVMSTWLSRRLEGKG